MPASQSLKSPTISRPPLFAAAALLLVGIGFACYLSVVKLKGMYLVDFKSSCSISQAVDCDAVQRSDYSTVLGVPLSLWGIATYAALMLLVWIGLRSDSSDDDADNPARAAAATGLLALVSGLTVLFSFYLMWVQRSKIGAVCPYCYGMYAVQAGVFICALLASSSRVRAVVDGLEALTSGSDVIIPSLIAFGLGLGGSLVWYVHEEDRIYVDGSEEAIAHVRDLMDAKEYEKAIEALPQLTSRQDKYGEKARQLQRAAIDAQFQSGFGDPVEAAPVVAEAAPSVPGVPTPPVPPAPSVPSVAVAPPTPSQPGGAVVAPPVAPRPATPGGPAKTGGKLTDLGWSYFETPLTDDDFVHGAPDAAVTIVEFADFECAYCKMLAENISSIRKKWEGKVKFVFKYYPMDGSCNPRMGGERMHPEACVAAKASYCAGKQGKFWEAHDKLFTMQKANQEDKLRGYMGELGVDLPKWDECYKSSAPLTRITNDIRLAAMAGINGTPRMYINNRLVSGASSVSIIEYYIQKALEAPAAPPPVAAAPAAKATAEMSPMVEVTTSKGKVFIDRFEASIDKEGRAASLPSVRPAQASWFEAKAACEKAGKRLCSEEEWSSACTGTSAVDDNGNGWFNDDTIEGNRYPYGAFYEAGTCNDDQETLTGAPVVTGARAGCATPSGIYDLAGNVAEWIDNDQARASLVGGNFGTGEGAACNQRGTMFGPGLRNNTTGFRCCSEAAVANASQEASSLAALPGDLVGKPIPSFSIQAADGKTVDDSTWKGKVSYVTFFASWCGSCKRELPEVELWNKEFKDKGFQVVAIGVDQAQSQSESFVKQHAPDATFTVAFDPDATAMTQFDIAAMPTSFIVDKTGVVRRRIVGFKKEEVAELKSFIQGLF